MCNVGWRFFFCHCGGKKTQNKLPLVSLSTIPNPLQIALPYQLSSKPINPFFVIIVTNQLIYLVDNVIVELPAKSYRLQVAG